MDAATQADRPVRTLCAVLYYTGCRISEALALTARRVDINGQTIIFESLKKRRRGVYRAVPVPGTLIDQLDMVHGIREAHRRKNGDILDAPLWPIARHAAATTLGLFSLTIGALTLGLLLLWPRIGRRLSAALLVLDRVQHADREPLAERHDDRMGGRVVRFLDPIVGTGDPRLIDHGHCRVLDERMAFAFVREDLGEPAPCANHATGISVPVTFSHGWWHPVMAGCSSGGMSSSWKVAIGMGCASSVISTTHRKAAG